MQNTERYSAVRKMAEVAVFSALLCVISPFAIPIGPVSITLATFGVYLSGAELGCKKGGAAVAVYLMLGFIGLPVFSGFMGGVQRLIGPTGGYLVGYIPCAMITGFFSRKFKRLWASAAGMALGTVVLYALGTASAGAFGLRVSLPSRRRRKDSLRGPARRPAEKARRKGVNFER